MQREGMEYGVSGVEVYSAMKQLLPRSVDPKIPLAVMDAPEDKLVESALASGEVKSFQFIETGDLIRAAVTIPSAKDSSQVAGVVVVDTFLPEALVAKMDRVTQSYKNFKEAMTYKDPIKAQYIALVVGIALVIILSGTWFGFQIAKGITVPIQKLAEGTQAVAAGGLDFRTPLQAHDEIGGLGGPFNPQTTDPQG